jgi:hypothetical protein
VSIRGGSCTGTRRCRWSTRGAAWCDSPRPAPSLSSLTSSAAWAQGTDAELDALATMRATLEKSLSRKGRALDLNLKRLQVMWMNVLTRSCPMDTVT